MSNHPVQVRMYTSAICPFCQRAERLLTERGVQHIEKIRIDLDPAQKEKMMGSAGTHPPKGLLMGSSKNNAVFSIQLKVGNMGFPAVQK